MVMIGNMCSFAAGLDTSILEIRRLSVSGRRRQTAGIQKVFRAVWILKLSYSPGSEFFHESFACMNYGFVD